jgi:hypothetical protein
MPGRAGVSEELYSGNLFRHARYIRINDNPLFLLGYTYLSVLFKIDRICKTMRIFPLGLASQDFTNLLTRHDTRRMDHGETEYQSLRGAL